MTGKPCMLKGSLEKNNYPHWPLYFSSGCPRMPIASKIVVMLAVEECKNIWPERQTSRSLPPWITWLSGLRVRYT